MYNINVWHEWSLEKVLPIGTKSWPLLWPWPTSRSIYFARPGTTIIADAHARLHTTVVRKPEERMPAYFAALHSGKELYHTFSGLSGRLGSSGLSAHASESTTERPEVSNYLPIQRFVYSLWPQILSIACTRAYVVDHCLQRCIGHYSAYLQRNRFRLWKM